MQEFYIVAEWCTFLSMSSQVVDVHILEGKKESKNYQLYLACSSVLIDSFVLCRKICTNSRVTPEFYIAIGQEALTSSHFQSALK